MKIAMIHPSLWGRGGAERQLLRLAIELQNFGHEIEIFTDYVDEECYPELTKNLTINVIPHPLWRLHKSLSYHATSSMIKREKVAPKKLTPIDKVMRKLVLKQFYTNELPIMVNLGRKIPKGFDLINNHNFPSEWAAFEAKRNLKVPIVWTCNNPPSWYFKTTPQRAFGKIYWPLYEFFDRTTVNYIDRIAVISYMSARDVKTVYGRETDIVRSGTDVDLLHSASGKNFREQHNLENSFVLLQVGNLGLVRGNINAIKILSILSKKFDNIKLVFDGYGAQSQIEALSSLAEKMGVKDKLLFCRSKSDKELAQVYAACDVFIYPSQLTWSLAVSEAMAAEKPVVVPKECGISEVIQNGVNGIVVDQTRPEDTAKQIEVLIQNQSLGRELGKNAYEYVRDHLSWQKYAKKMEIVFEKTIS